MTPQEIDAQIALGFSYVQAGEHGLALDVYSKILTEHPNYALAHYYAGQVLLSNGHFEQGWEQCEWRPLDEMPSAFKRWQGESLLDMEPESVLLVAGEQGMGDIIQFARYIPLLKPLVPKVVLGTLSGMGDLMSTLPGISAVVERGGALPRVTHYVPMLSLPYIFKTTLETIPSQVPYLSANPIKVEEWRQRLSWVEGPKVGLVWAGNPSFPGDIRRSPGFEPYRALLNVPGITFFALQKGEGAKALEGIPLPSNLFDLGPELHSLEDTAAVMMNLDLVISSCTSPVHLAGALGRPLWLVVSSFPDWRWLRHDETTPWYPTARLFRQKPDEPWGSVLERVALSLAQARR